MIKDNELLLKQVKEGDKEAREVLIQENMGLVGHIVKRYQDRGVEAEDLIQIGTIGLMKAIDHFDFSFQVCFSTYAVPMISGEIRRFLRDDGMIKVSRNVKENYRKIMSVTEKFFQTNGREATLSELSKELDISVEDILLAQEAKVEITSIYQAAYQSDGSEVYLVDKLAHKCTDCEAIYETPPLEQLDGEKERLLNKIVLGKLLDSLEKDEKQLIYLRYFQDKTQNEVAKILHTTQVRISRLEKKILLKMKKQI